jgi:hypothetical protein
MQKNAPYVIIDICAPYVIIPHKNIYSGYFSQNGHERLDDDILQLFKVSGFS